MKELSCIIWDQSYCVNVEAIDAQHRKLFDIVNQLIELHEGGSDELLPVLNDLVDYLYDHFHTEQMVMMNANFPGYLEHNKAHQKFTEKMHEFLKSYEEGKKDLAFDMLSYLRVWVRDHTLKVDRQYGEYILRTTGGPQQAHT